MIDIIALIQTLSITNTLKYDDISLDNVDLISHLSVNGKED
jgi:hypothetical protein